MAGKISECVVGGSRHRYRPLFATTFKANDDVFLKDRIVLECLAARLEQVHVADGSACKHELAKRSIVRPVAETARDDRDDLPGGCCLRYRQRHEGRIQIYRLDADTTQCQTVRGIVANFLVRRIENDVAVLRE